MQYVARAGGYVYNQWNSLNPATLSGAIDVIVIEQEDGTLHCSPFHVRFGKFQIFKPSQKKIDLYVNGIKTDLPMKLGDEGEAFFVFETDNADMLSQSVLTSPVISPETSPGTSPEGSPRLGSFDLNKTEPEEFDLEGGKLVARDSAGGSGSKEGTSDGTAATGQSEASGDVEDKIELTQSPVQKSSSGTGQLNPRDAFERARKITEKLKIPSKIDVNGDMVLDMDGYEPSSQKNIENSDEMFQKIFFDEIGSRDSSQLGDDSIWSKIITKDKNGNIRILNTELQHGANLEELRSSEGMTEVDDDEGTPEHDTTATSTDQYGDEKTYFKTLRLTSDQLKKMRLNFGENSLKFKSSEGKSQIEANLFLWKSNIPIVISDIDGTITKSDALGHVLNLIGRDWTHPGVATLFQDISANGYNIVYLTARSVGLSDTTRQYLRGILQDGSRLPAGPVILSPDRTLAALRREIVLKKPEVFKMACLNDIKSLYFNSGVLDDDDDRTPFYAGFGNRITDAISYRSVKIPSHRIFTINPNGEVHMELLELSGQKSSYLLIGELVDLFFPPLPEVSTLTDNYNQDQYDDYINYKDQKEREENSASPSSPRSPGFMPIPIEEKFTDVNYWREPMNLSDLSEFEDEDENPPPKSPVLAAIKSFDSTLNVIEDGTKPKQETPEVISPKKTRPTSMESFTSPLKSFMMFGNKSKNQEDDDGEYEDSNFEMPGTFQTDDNDEDDFTGEDDDDEDDEDYEDDYDDDEEDDDEEDDDYEDDYYEDDDGVEEENEEAEDADALNEVDDEDVDYEDTIPAETKVKPVVTDELVAKFVKASEFENLKINDKAQE